jgi:hypothetical protein
MITSKMPKRNLIKIISQVKGHGHNPHPATIAYSVDK